MRLDVKVAIVQSGRHQYEIAREIGISENSLSKYIRGHASLRVEHIKKLHDLLGLEAELAPTVADGDSA
jgi:transcriptional regulator with XRE-family HTH domain